MQLIQNVLRQKDKQRENKSEDSLSGQKKKKMFELVDFVTES